MNLPKFDKKKAPLFIFGGVGLLAVIYLATRGKNGGPSEVRVPVFFGKAFGGSLNGSGGGGGGGLYQSPPDISGERIKPGIGPTPRIDPIREPPVIDDLSNAVRRRTPQVDKRGIFLPSDPTLLETREGFNMGRELATSGANYGDY